MHREKSKFKIKNYQNSILHDDVDDDENCILKGCQSCPTVPSEIFLQNIQGLLHSKVYLQNRGHIIFQNL